MRRWYLYLCQNTCGNPQQSQIGGGGAGVSSSFFNLQPEVNTDGWIPALDGWMYGMV